ncbi:MAG TPA: exodeoxyribonuclease VII large subunit [Bryobacteraceae bacterium]|nr:exodeoxyribonuclease VII large subunit [Bryobacteraceae bacterium]
MQIPFAWEAPKRLFTVSELTDAIRDTLAAGFTDIWLAGEISGCKAGPSGHIYFTLKDQGAQISCALFARTARFMKFKPRDGVQVLVRGRVDVYAARGAYQMLVDSLEPQGFGALQLAFEQLKKKLAAEGLFDAARKRPIPLYPRRIGIVTSPSGAVLRDMINILTRRFPGLHIRLYPAQVQGEGSLEQICRAIDYFHRSPWADVLIVARGGGSVEDLWTFNEEAVARAIAACAVPVISAVGHETDFTIADFAADLRAPTPSAAAELVVGTRQQLVERLQVSESRFKQGLRYRISVARRRLHQLGVEGAGSALHRLIGKRMQRVDEFEGRAREVLRALIAARRKQAGELDAMLRRLDLRLRLAEGKRRLQAARTRLEERMRSILTRAHRRLEPLDAHLSQLSPLRVLERGYAIVQNSEGAVVKEPAQAPQGTRLRVHLAKGEIAAEVIP